MDTNLVFPQQRLSFKEKIKDDFKWAKRTIDYVIRDSYTLFNTESKVKDSRHSQMLNSYLLYNNVIDQTEFEADCNALGIEVGQYKDEIKAYNKIPNKINWLLGQEYKRAFNYKVVLVNSDGIKSKLEFKKKLLSEFVENYVTQNYAQVEPPQQQGQEQQQPSKSLEAIEEYMTYTYMDAKERLANQLMQFLLKKERLIDKKNDSFKHGLISGEEHVWVGIENNEPVTVILNPLGVFYHKSADVKYVEDGMYAGYKTKLTIGDVLDKFAKFLSKSDVERLEQMYSGSNTRDDHPTDLFFKAELEQEYGLNAPAGSYSPFRMDDIEVTHVEWVSQKRIGFLKENGEETMMVSEDLVIPPYAEIITSKGHYGETITEYVWDNYSLEWGYIPEVWEGVKIGENIYCCIGPKKYQYRSVDNPYKVKLGYHGLVYSNTNAPAISIVQRMKPFQHIYSMVCHKLKRLIARDKGKTFPLDTTMIDPIMGIEKTLYYLEEMDYDFYNPLQNAERPGAHQRGGKVSGAVDRSNIQQILAYFQSLALLDEQINDVAGIPRGAEGQTPTNQAVTNAQSDIAMSSNIIEAVYMKPHDLLWENVLNSLIQCAQVAYQNKSITKQYVLDDLSLQTLEIPSDSLVNCDLGLFISNATKDTRLFEQLQNLAQPLLQNDKAKLTDIIKILKGTSARELEIDILKSESKAQQEQLEQIRAQQESQKQASMMAQQMKAQEFQHAKELQAQKDAAAKEREMIKALSWAEDTDINDNEVPDIMELEKLKADITIKKEQMQHETEENKKDRESAEKLARIKASKVSKTPK
jgi:hypothetical protein